MALTQAELDAAQAQINAARDQTHTNIGLAEGWAQIAQDAAEASGSASAQAATAEANRAGQQKALAEAARTGAETAQGLSEDARGLAEAARTGAEAAQGLSEDARDRAETAADSFDLTATVTTGAAGSNAAVEVTGDGPAYALRFTVPRGDKGDPGQKGDKGDDGEIPPYLQESALNATYRSRVAVTNYGLWVSPTGSDTTGDGLSEATAVKTLAEAHARCNSGDTVNLSAGFHNEQPAFTMTKALTWVGQGAPSRQGWYHGGAPWATRADEIVGGTVVRPQEAATGQFIAVEGYEGAMAYGTTFRDFSIVGHGPGTGLVLGTDSATTYGDILVRVRIDNVNVANFETGVLSNIENSVVNGLFIQCCLVGMRTRGANNGNTYMGLNIERTDTVALDLAEAQGNAFIGGVFQANRGKVLRFGNQAESNVVSHVYLENNEGESSAEFLTGSVGNHLLEPHIISFNRNQGVVIAGAYNGITAHRYNTAPIDLTGWQCYARGRFPATITPLGEPVRPAVMDLAPASGNVIDAPGFPFRLTTSRLSIGSGLGVDFGTAGATIGLRVATGALQLYGGESGVEIVDNKIKLGSVWLRTFGGKIQTSPDGFEPWTNYVP